jgi:hypothetical protein
MPERRTVMSDQPKTPPVDPADNLAGQGIRGEPLGCPTGLIDPSEPLPGDPGEKPQNTTDVQRPLQVEKLEGRQESGRDAQGEEDEGA